MGFMKKKPVAPPIMVPKSAPVAAPIKAPTVDNSAAELQKAQESELERLRKQRGRAATILTSGYGVQGDDSFSKATLG
jgi:hypothetical protein